MKRLCKLPLLLDQILQLGFWPVLGIANCERFVEAVKNFPRIFRRLAGKAAKIKERAAEIQRGWAHGINAARQIFSGQPAP